MAYLKRHIPNIEFQQNTINNETKRILSHEARMKAMLVQMADITQATESQLSLLKRAANILWSIFLNFR